MEAGMHAVLSVERLTLRAGTRTLVEGLTFTLAPKELVTLEAPSGAGKTTLLRALAYLDTPAAGRITYDGQTPEDWGLPTYRRKVTYLSQRPGWYETSLRDNLMRPFTYQTRDHAYPEAEVHRLMDRLALDREVLERPAQTLSEGEQQRAALIRTLIIRPAILLLDEPTSALDPGRAREVEALVTERVEAGQGVLWVSHDPQQRDRLGARRLTLSS